MKNSIFVVSVFVCSLAARAVADPGDRHFLFKASAVFPVQIEKLDNQGNTIVTKLTLGTKELINLTLARPFDHPIASNELLVVNVTEQNPDQTRLQVYVRPADGSEGGTLYPLCTVTSGGSPATKTTQNASSDRGKGAGLGPGTIAATTAGTDDDRLKNSLESTDICASANASWTPKVKHVPGLGDQEFAAFSCSATGIIGDIKGKLTSQKTGSVTVVLDGLIVKGAFTGSGTPIKPYPFGFVE